MKQYTDIHCKLNPELGKEVEIVAKAKFDGNVSATIRYAITLMLKRERSLIDRHKNKMMC